MGGVGGGTEGDVVSLPEKGHEVSGVTKRESLPIVPAEH